MTWLCKLFFTIDIKGIWESIRMSKEYRGTKRVGAPALEGKESQPVYMATWTAALRIVSRLIRLKAQICDEFSCNLYSFHTFFSETGRSKWNWWVNRRMLTAWSLFFFTTSRNIGHWYRFTNSWSIPHHLLPFFSTWKWALLMHCLVKCGWRATPNAL